jgi:hypothetical protein
MDSWTNADSLRNESWRSAGEERKQIDEDGKPERKESDLAGRTSRRNWATLVPWLVLCKIVEIATERQVFS